MIGIRHGEKMYETLLTNEECAKAVDLGDFYRVPADNRGLNYDKYFKEGDVKRNKLTEFNSNNSETLPEESSFYLSIGHPIAAVCIRTSTERPEALEAGDFILAGITTKELLNATDMAIAMKKNGVLGKPCPDYVDETVSMKVVRIIQGYVNVVNKMVWRKDQ